MIRAITSFKPSYTDINFSSQDSAARKAARRLAQGAGEVVKEPKSRFWAEIDARPMTKQEKEVAGSLKMARELDDERAFELA